MMQTNPFPIDTQPSIAVIVEKSLNCLSAFKLDNYEKRSRVKWRGVLFLVLLLDKQKKNACCKQTKQLIKMIYQTTPEKCKIPDLTPKSLHLGKQTKQRERVRLNRKIG